MAASDPLLTFRTCCPVFCAFFFTGGRGLIDAALRKGAVCRSWVCLRWPHDPPLAALPCERPTPRSLPAVVRANDLVLHFDVSAVSLMGVA